MCTVYMEMQWMSETSYYTGYTINELQDYSCTMMPYREVRTCIITQTGRGIGVEAELMKIFVCWLMLTIWTVSNVVNKWSIHHINRIHCWCKRPWQHQLYSVFWIFAIMLVSFIWSHEHEHNSYCTWCTSILLYCISSIFICGSISADTWVSLVGGWWMLAGVLYNCFSLRVIESGLSQVAACQCNG